MTSARPSMHHRESPPTSFCASLIGPIDRLDDMPMSIYLVISSQCPPPLFCNAWATSEVPALAGLRLSRLNCPSLATSFADWSGTVPPYCHRDSHTFVSSMHDRRDGVSLGRHSRWHAQIRIPLHMPFPFVLLLFLRHYWGVMVYQASMGNRHFLMLAYAIAYFRFDLFLLYKICHFIGRKHTTLFCVF